MSDEGTVVTELVAKLGIEADSASFASADKMLDGIASVMSQLVGALQQVTSRLDVMAAHAAQAGELLTGMFEGAAAEAAKFSAVHGPELPPVAPGMPSTSGEAPTERPAPFHGPELPPEMQRERDVAAARTRLQAAQSKKEIEHLAKVDLGMVDYGPELPPAAKALKATGEAAAAAAPQVGFMQKALGAVSIALAANFGLHTLENFVHGLIAASGAIIGTSQRLGISKAAVQELGFAAKISEADIGTLETGLKFLQQNSSQAAKGSKSDAKAFKDLGVTIKDSSGHVKNADVLFEEVADAINKLPTDAAKTAAAMQLFGRSGAQLLPMLKLGGQGIRDLRKEAKDLGGGLSDDVIDQTDEFDDNLTRLSFAMQGLKSVIGNILLPVFSVFVEGLTKGVSWIKKLWTETYYLQTVAVVAFGVIAANSARAAAAVVADWVVAAAPFIGFAVAIGVFAVALEDIYMTFSGGKGQIGLWLDEWKGAGTTDGLVRNLAAGMSVLAEALKGLFSLEPGKFFQAMGEGLQGVLKYFSGGDDKRREIQFAEARKMSASKDPKQAAAGRARIEALQGADFNGAPVERALARGLDVGVQKQEFGRASIGSNSATGATVNNVSVTVQAQTNADPKEIARHASKAVQEGMAKQNRNLKAAHARQ